MKTSVRRRRFATVAGVVLVSQLAVFGPAVLAGAFRDSSLTGTLEVMTADDFVTAPVHSYWLKTATGRVSVKFPHHPPVAGGARVRVLGQAASDSMTASSVDVLTPAVAAASPDKRIAVILANFSNNASQPYTPSAITSTLLTGTASVKKFYEEESRGAITISAQVFGWYTIAATNAGCETTLWDAQAEAAARAAGADLSSFTNIMVVWPAVGSCPWSGVGSVNGPYTFINGTFNLRIVAHELGHNFGVMHASSLSCMNGAVRVSLSTTCTYAEYGDPYTVMGGASTFHNPALMVGQFGWLAPGEVQTIPGPGTYALSPLLGTPSGTVKLLKLRPWRRDVPLHGRAGDLRHSVRQVRGEQPGHRRDHASNVAGRRVTPLVAAPQHHARRCDPDHDVVQ